VWYSILLFFISTFWILKTIVFYISRHMSYLFFFVWFNPLCAIYLPLSTGTCALCNRHLCMCYLAAWMQWNRAWS
jgi:hypothetical protein